MVRLGDTDYDMYADDLVSLSGWGTVQRDDINSAGMDLRDANLGIFPQYHCNDTHTIKDSKIIVTSL